MTKTVEQNNFQLDNQYPTDNKSVILYDFRNILASVSTLMADTGGHMKQKNIYGLSEGVFKACQFLGLKFPTDIPKEFDPSDKHVPSDYFGKDFEFNPVTLKKLLRESKLTEKQFANQYKKFVEKFFTQKSLKHTKTDANVFFCDYILFVKRQTGASCNEYFNFEFYRKSLALQKTFRLRQHTQLTKIICNDFFARSLLWNKAKTNKFFGEFLHRDWLNTGDCTFEEFKTFVKKHAHFFSKIPNGDSGKGAGVVSLNSNEDINKIFKKFRKQKRILEEIVVQHEDISAFCPDTVNTIRINTILDIHNVVHILTANGRFGRKGAVIDNFHGGGVAVVIDPITGIITSEGINEVHERFQAHPDTGKTFKGFQYPSWKKVRAIVEEMAKLIPQLRYVGWDIAINYKGEPLLIEANGSPDLGLQQAADGRGRRYLYEPILEELRKYRTQQMRLLGYRVNNLSDSNFSYNNPSRTNSRLKFAIDKLIPECASLMDVGCRKGKRVKAVCPEGVKYFPVDYKAYDDEVIACDFNTDDFPDINVDTCLCALTAEYVKHLPQFLANMCNAAQKQILMLCRPVDKERSHEYRRENPFPVDFTEDFLIKTMERNNFKLNKKYPTDIKSVILYDFRKIFSPV